MAKKSTKAKSPKKKAHDHHEKSKPEAPKKAPVETAPANDAVMKVIFVVLGIALLVAAYYVGYLVGSGASGDNGGGIEPADGAVVITEFSDFECPFCERFYTETYSQIKSTYGDDVVFEFKNFPLSMHASAQKAAEAAACARDQGKFWEYHDVLFESRKLDVASLKQHAADLGLDTGKFDSCLDSGEKASVIQDDIAEGTAAGVRGTPSFLINGELVVGAQPFSTFKTKIDAALAGEAPAPAAPAQPTQPTAPPAPEKVEGDLTDDDAVKGDPDAPVTIVEFSDYECPFCGRHFQQTYPQIVENFVNTGKVKIIFRDFPLSFHPKAQKAAEAAECAGEQGKYWEMHDKLYSNQQSLSEDNYKKWAGEIGLDQQTFDDCLDNGDMASEVSADFEDGRKYGVTGTPAFFINGVKVSGAQPYPVFEAAINAALEE